MLAYFCFLEQLLVILPPLLLQLQLQLQTYSNSFLNMSGWENGYQRNCHITSIFMCARATCIHDLFYYGYVRKTITCCKMMQKFSALDKKFVFLVVKRRFVWVYASVQFALVVLFAHIFYSLVRTTTTDTDTDTTHMFLELEVLILLFMSINCRFEYKQCYQFFFLHLLVLELQWVEVQYLSSSWDGEDDNRRWETNCIQFFWVDGLNQLKCWQQQQHHHRLRPHWLL